MRAIALAILIGAVTIRNAIRDERWTWKTGPGSVQMVLVIICFVCILMGY
jgi:hypothetical protein